MNHGTKWCGYTDNHETCLQTCCMRKKAFRALGMVQRAMPNSTPCCSHSQLATVKLVATLVLVLHLLSFSNLGLKFILEQAMKAQRGRRSIALPFL
jgi:hypothetical protein